MENTKTNVVLKNDGTFKQTNNIWNKIRDTEVGRRIVKLRKKLHIPQLVLNCTLNEKKLREVGFKRIKIASNFYIARLGVSGIPLIIIKHYARGFARLANFLLFIVLSILLITNVINLDMGIILAYFLIEFVILGRIVLYSKLEGMTLFTLIHYDTIMKLEYNVSERKYGNKKVDIIISILFIAVVFGLATYFIIKLSNI